MKKFMVVLVVMLCIAVFTVSRADAAKMYWTESQGLKVGRADLDGGNAESLVTTGLTEPVGIALDVGADQMYFTDMETGSGAIRRADLDGSNLGNVITASGNSDAEGIALDLTANKMYWADWNEHRIQRANLDGSGTESLIASGLNQPMALALDLIGGKMYWTEWSGYKVRRANLDGSDVEDLITGGEYTSGFAGIALDLAHNKICWTSVDGSKIQRANLDGSEVEDLFDSEGEAPPWAIALDVASGKMYWTDTVGQVRRANLDGSSIEDLVTGLNHPRGLALDLTPAVVPEPAGLGLLGLALLAVRRKRT